MKCIPKLNAVYWAALILASIFGANAGDFLAGVLHLGHLRGIPFLAVALVAVFLIERASRRASALYYWAAIIIIRASATNIGDAFRDFGIGFAWSVPTVLLVMIAAIVVWQRVGRPVTAQGVPSADGFYWTVMFLAGVLGTLVGDAVSFPLHFGNLGATFALGLPLAMLLLIGRNGLLSRVGYYWTTVVLIRSAGTAAGDQLAHHIFGLSLSTAVTGLVFVTVIVIAYAPSDRNTTLTGAADANARAAAG
jgi:uncharacterized membrane-anchored protein